MNLLIFVLSLRFLLIIDRIEDDFVVIEWKNKALSTIPLDLIPCPVQEGDFLYLQIYPSKNGAYISHSSPPILQFKHGILAIPMPIELQKNTTYGILIQCLQPQKI